MKQTKLLKLTLKNFKQFDDLTLDFKGENAVLSGRNASGKSTVADAFEWLLKGKNFDGNTKFSITPLDENGNEKRGCVTIVTAELNIDGKPITITKEQFENVTKKEREFLTPGSIAPKKIKYFIDDVPIDTETAFKGFITSKIADDETMKLISSVSHFIGLKPEQQRQALIKLFDMDIASIPDYEKVSHLLENVSIDDKLKAHKTKLKSMDKQLDEINTRKDEIKDSFDVTADYESLLQALDKEINAERENLKTVIESEQIKELSIKCDADLQVLVDKIVEADKGLEESEKKLSENTKYYLTKEAKLNEIKAKGNTINNEIDKASNKEPDTLCPTCKRAFENAAETKKQHEKIKAETIEKLESEKKELASEYKTVKAELDSLITISDKLEQARNTDRTIVNDLKNESYELSKKFINEKSELEKTLQAESLNKITELTLEKEKLNVFIKAKARFKELTELQQNLTAEKGSLSHEADIMEQILKERNKRLETAVNSEFKAIQFKLFEMQTNGEYKEVCKPTIDGVYYADANTASQINATLEILDVFIKNLKISMPIFIDKVNLVNNVYTIQNAQTIQQLVTNDDLKLELI